MNKVGFSHFAAEFFADAVLRRPCADGTAPTVAENE